MKSKQSLASTQPFLIFCINFLFADSRDILTPTKKSPKKNKNKKQQKSDKKDNKKPAKAESSDNKENDVETSFEKSVDVETTPNITSTEEEGTTFHDEALVSPGPPAHSSPCTEHKCLDNVDSTDTQQHQVSLHHIHRWRWLTRSFVMHCYEVFVPLMQQNSLYHFVMNILA